MSHWADYIDELRGRGFRTFLEAEHGFVAYSFPEWATECIMIHDIYVTPAARRQHRGLEFLAQVEQIGREAGRKYVISELEIKTEIFELSFRAQVGAGFMPISAYSDKILMRKEIT